MENGLDKLTSREILQMYTRVSEFITFLNKEENKLIKELNNTNIWALDDNDIYFTSHILLNESIDENGLIELKNNIKKYLINLNITHITLEIVYNNETKRKTN